jgi:hypothetical protein
MKDKESWVSPATEQGCRQTTMLGRTLLILFVLLDGNDEKLDENKIFAMTASCSDYFDRTSM